MEKTDSTITITELWGTIHNFREETDKLRREINKLRFAVRVCFGFIAVLFGIIIAFL